MNPKTQQTIEDVIAVQSGASATVYKPLGTKISYHAYGATSTGAGTATVVIEGSMDQVGWFNIDSLSLSFNDTDLGGDFGMSVGPFKYVRMRVSVIAGTDSTIQGFLCTNPTT